jgi:hypothetical protein
MRLPGQKTHVVRRDAPRPGVTAAERAEPASRGSFVDVYGGDSLYDRARAVELVSHQREEVSHPVTSCLAPPPDADLAERRGYLQVTGIRSATSA